MAVSAPLLRNIISDIPLSVGLTSILNDVITELNSTLQSQSKGRSGKANIDPNQSQFGLLSQQVPKIDVMSLIPTLLIVGLGITLLPIIITCFTQILSPITYLGRRKRDVGGSQFPFENNLVLGLLTKLEDAISKFDGE